MGLTRFRTAHVPDVGISRFRRRGDLQQLSRSGNIPQVLLHESPCNHHRHGVRVSCQGKPVGRHAPGRNKSAHLTSLCGHCVRLTMSREGKVEEATHSQQSRQSPWREEDETRIVCFADGRHDDHFSRSGLWKQYTYTFSDRSLALFTSLVSPPLNERIPHACTGITYAPCSHCGENASYCRLHKIACRTMLCLVLSCQVHPSEIGLSTLLTRSTFARR